MPIWSSAVLVQWPIAVGKGMDAVLLSIVLAASKFAIVLAASKWLLVILNTGSIVLAASKWLLVILNTGSDPSGCIQRRINI
jgi:hypothetical protein